MLIFAAILTLFFLFFVLSIAGCALVDMLRDQEWGTATTCVLIMVLLIEICWLLIRNVLFPQELNFY